MSLFFSSRCMLELKFARAASLSSQASFAVLAEKSQAFFKHSPHTNSISNSAILCINYISLLSDLCACVHVKKNGVVKEAIVLQWAVRIASCDFKPGKKQWAGSLLSEKCCCFAKTIVKESRKFELARLKKKKENHFGRLATFWFGSFAMHFSATGCVVHHENTRRWTVGCYNGS